MSSGFFIPETSIKHLLSIREIAFFISLRFKLSSNKISGLLFNAALICESFSISISKKSPFFKNLMFFTKKINFPK